MLELILLPMFLLSLDPPSSAVALEVELAAPSVEFVLGEPVRLTARVRNVSGAPIDLVQGGRVGFRVVFSATRSDGLSWDGCREKRRGRPRLTVERVPPDWEREFSTTFDCLDEPGDYVLRCVAGSDGLTSGRTLADGGDASGAWTGKLDCADVAIRIVAPVGSDREAFDYFRADPLGDPDELLRLFPTSTYAGHALVEGGPWRLDPVAEVEIRGSYLKTVDVDPVARPQMERLEAEQFALSVERARLLERYLAAQPNFVYADFMRLELATRLAYLGEQDRARELCTRLIDEAKGGYEATKAAELLTYCTRPPKVNGCVSDQRNLISEVD